MKNKKILFRPFDYITEQVTEPPVSAKSIIPDWYKKVPANFKGKKHVSVNNLSSDKTLKACMPFLDSITSGYLLRMPGDLVCDYDENGQRQINWMSLEYKLASEHSMDQLGKYPIPEGYEHIPFQLKGFWGVQTPKNYSLMFMHPLGRLDLPFYSFHGIVDSDKHYVPMHIPFVLKEGFTGVIKRGTPYSQIIPIPRDSWESEIIPFDWKKYNPSKVYADIGLSAEKWYKERFWSRKEYN